MLHGTPLVRKSSACEVSQSTVMRGTAVYSIGNNKTNPLRPLSLEGKFGRVLQHQDRPVCRGKALARRRKMTHQDRRFADPFIGKETIGRLGVRPVLAS